MNLVRNASQLLSNNMNLYSLMFFNFAKTYDIPLFCINPDSNEEKSLEASHIGLPGIFKS
ncbi:hypothetical protein DSOL_3888 [Desulfosporosinus metallidurans]|uniref:Uncharacterized protein n=1 Tax=Desulfosporosinus metallidurans TaxID=1888891 RepID=A0A1Q8QN84_9FIRM|nr:hypothetical protein DSOL_3888 [Desulfosporosinus metallidurans]